MCFLQPYRLGWINLFGLWGALFSLFYFFWPPYLFSHQMILGLIHLYNWQKHAQLP